PVISAEVRVHAEALHERQVAHVDDFRGRVRLDVQDVIVVASIAHAGRIYPSPPIISVCSCGLSDGITYEITRWRPSSSGSITAVPRTPSSASRIVSAGSRRRVPHPSASTTSAVAAPMAYGP